MSFASARLLFAALAGLTAAPIAMAQAPAKVTVTVQKVVGANGALLGQLCADPSSFGNNCSDIKARASAPAKDGSVDLVFTDVPPGTYALSLYHDENGDGRFSIFSEPMAFGNDAHDLPPVFDRAALKVTGDLKTETELFRMVQ